MPVSRAIQPEPAIVAPAPASAGLFAGTSGWAYATWKPGFYPATVSAKKFLGYDATQMNSVEVNYIFRLRRNGGYTDTEIAAFAAKFLALAADGREVYAYFKHEDQPAGAWNGAAPLRLAVEGA